MNSSMKGSGIRLKALNGANPLAFLAALGALRLLHGQGLPVRMRWVWDGGWRPELAGLDFTEGELAVQLRTCGGAPMEELGRLGKNLTVAPGVFRSVAREAMRRALAGDFEVASYVAAFGCEAVPDRKLDRIQYTKLSFITGSGHQDFLGTATKLEQCVAAEHIAVALFGPWRREKGLSFRWDPADAVEYARQWDDPGPQGASAVWGANWLAFQALPLLPAFPVIGPWGANLRTTAMVRGSGPDPEFRWPIWTCAIGLDAARSLLSLGEIASAPADGVSLREMGVAQVFSARRIRIGQGANFKVSFRAATAV